MQTAHVRLIYAKLQDKIMRRRLLSWRLRVVGITNQWESEAKSFTSLGDNAYSVLYS